MGIIMMAIEWSIASFVAIMFLKSSLIKMKNPYLFYLIVVKDYKIMLPYIDKIFVPLFIIFELMISMWIIIPNTRAYGAAIGLLLQIIFITIMIFNYGKVFRYGCGCFELNFPKKITIKKINFNFALGICFTIIIYLKM